MRVLTGARLSLPIAPFTPPAPLVRLTRPARACTQSKLSGVIVVDTESSLSHAGVTLVAEGCVKPQLSARSVGIFEAFYSSIKPMTVLRSDIEIQKPGKFPAGATEVPFELPVEALPSMVRHVVDCDATAPGFAVRAQQCAAG